MPRFKKFQNSMLGGEIDPEFIMRGDAETANQACKAARNVALLTGGGAVRRPGTPIIAPGVGQRYVHFRNKAGTTVIAAFSNLLVTLLDATTGASIASNAAPWPSAEIDNLDIVDSDGGLYVFSASYPIHFISYETAFSVHPFAFGIGVDGITQQPYFRYAARGITMSTSNVTGVIDIGFSDNVLVAGHVGTIFRRAGKEMRIETVVNGTTGTATVLQELFPTLRVPVADSSIFRPGQIVEGSETGYSAEVASIVGFAVIVVMRNSYDLFFHNAADPTLSEKLVGPTGASKINNVVTVVASQDALDWDEQMISSVRGYPSAGTVHRNRLVMAGFPSARKFVAASAVGDSRNFNTRAYDDAGVGENDAFVEGIGVSDVEIRRLASLENLVILCDRGVFYVPELDFPFAPGSVRFFKVGPDGASKAIPAVVTEGLIYVDVSGGKIMGVIPTGLVGRPWEIRELSQAASHLIASPKAIYTASTVGARRHRMVFVLNADGTVAVLSYLRFENFAGWTLWSRNGATFETIAVNDADVLIGFLRGGTRILCRLDWNATLDEAVSYAVSAPAHSSDTITIAWNGHFAGRHTLDGAGITANVTPTAGMEAGYDFDVRIEPFPPFDVERGRNPTAVTRLWVHVKDSGAFQVNGEYWSPYTFDDSLFEPPRRRTGDVDFLLFDNPGESFLVTPVIEQTECAPLHIQALTIQGRF